MPCSCTRKVMVSCMAYGTTWQQLVSICGGRPNEVMDICDKWHTCIGWLYNSSMQEQKIPIVYILTFYPLCHRLRSAFEKTKRHDISHHILNQPIQFQCKRSIRRHSKYESIGDTRFQLNLDRRKKATMRCSLMRACHLAMLGSRDSYLDLRSQNTNSVLIHVYECYKSTQERWI